MTTQLPILQVVLPLLAAPLCLLIKQPRLVWLFSLITSLIAFAISLLLINQVPVTTPEDEPIVINMQLSQNIQLIGSAIDEESGVKTNVVLIQAEKADNYEYYGAYTFEDVDCNKTYTIRGSKPDYKDDLVEVTTDDEKDKEHTADLSLIPLIKGNEIVINPIFFDFDKWNIRPDAAYELENIVAVMQEHPKMVIKIESHTDSRGRDKYNMKLSDRRAKSTKDYLLSRNIAPERIESAIGYGETQLLNECSNGVKCSKEKHQLNRRSKFLIVQGKCEK